MLFFILYIFNYGLNLNVCKGYHLYLKKFDGGGGSIPWWGELLQPRAQSISLEIIKILTQPNVTKSNTSHYPNLDRLYIHVLWVIFSM